MKEPFIKWCMHCKGEYECSCAFPKRCSCHVCGQTPVLRQVDWWNSKPAIERHERSRAELKEIERQIRADSTINPF